MMRYIGVWSMVFGLFFMQWVSFALTPKEEKGVITLKAPSLVYETPDWARAFPLDEAPDDVDYRKSILPYEEDRDAYMYIVLPTLGVVSPVVHVPKGTKDFNDMIVGKQIEINNYLDRGVMHYPRTGVPGEVGNPVIFWHSNFFKNGVGDYKTIFADIMNLDVSPRDEMWVFVKEESGDYDLRKFEIVKSYETDPSDVGVMVPEEGKEMTVFACTNGLAGRWILKGKYIELDEMLVTYPLKWELWDRLTLVEQQEATTKQDTIATVLAKIETIREQMPTRNLDYHDKYKKYLLNYMEKKILEAY